MKATQVEFRLRLLILLALYFIGFYAPWLRFGAVAPTTTAWLALSTTLFRWQWLPLDQASLLVTGLAVLCAVIGAALRVWGTAYLGSGVVNSQHMQAGQVMAAGPYRYVRNPLYVGSWILSLGIAFLMPPSGALVFLVLEGLFYFRLILGEEAFLTAQQGESYLEYRRRVPRLLARLRPGIPASGAHPQWLTSLAAESFPVLYAVCLATLAWQYNPRLLIRCLLVTFGLSLVTRALLPRSPTPAD
ncbi:MAG TPA: isoprenylcysteine carboxylmethyltransferase family protein [Acidobacteriaceae bacterium]|jgi:protein-S-isoprenylcysteine O-methyltransferase Ste14|nr:isoprenylcysteine carboxylmethyltransferase family protein [Acidobacteriaceae bacterium]